MPEWWKIYSEDGVRLPDDEQGMLQAAAQFNGIIDELAAKDNIPLDRIVMGGFSQGAALSLLTALEGKRKIGGLAILSGWLPLHSKRYDQVRTL